MAYDLSRKVGGSRESLGKYGFDSNPSNKRMMEIQLNERG